MNLIKKLFVYAIVFATIVTMSLPAGIAVAATNVAAGDLIKANNSAAVYYYNGSERFAFPNPTVYFSWYQDFSTVKTITAEELAAITYNGKLVTVRPGTKLVKITSDPKVYAIEPGGKLRSIPSEAVAATLYGSNWAKMVTDVSDAFWFWYDRTNTTPLSSTHPTGSLVKYANSNNVYYIDGTSKRLVSEAGMTANKFDMDYVLTIPDTITYTDGTQVTAMEDGLFPITSGTTATPPVSQGSLSVSLAANTAPSGTIITGQAIANLASFNLTASNEGAVKITSLKLKRTGVSADATLSKVYLFEGINRLTDDASISSGYASWTNASGIIEIPAGQTKTITVKSDIATGTSGQIVGVSLESAGDITTGNSITGSFPVNGNLMSIASATLATVAYNATTYPTTANVAAGETNYTIWKNVISIGTRDVKIDYIKFRQIGSVSSSDLKNLTFYVDGVQKGSVMQLGSDQNVIFDFSSNPVLLTAGSRNLEVRADIVSGSSKTFSMSVQRAADAAFKDVEYGVYVTPTALPATSGTMTIENGSLTVNLMPDSPSGNVTKDAPGVTLAKYEVKAYGESIKIENLRITATSTNDSTVTKLRGGAIYVNGAQIGSTADLNMGTSYTDYSLGSSLVVVPGTPVVLEIRADIFDNDGTNNITANDTLKASILTYTNGAQRMNSLTYINVPTAATTDGNVVTVATGSLTTTKNTAYGDQSVVNNVNNVKIGSYIVSAAQGEDVNISNLTAAVTYTDTTSDSDTAATTMSDLYLVVDGVSTTPKTVGTSNNFSVNKRVTNNSQIVVDIYANINSTADATDVVTTSLAITALTASSGTNADCNAVIGQSIEIASGSFYVTLSPNTPNTDIVIAGNTNVKVAEYKFTSLNTPIVLKDVTVKLVTAASSRSVVRGGLDIDGNGTPDAYATFVLSGGNYYASFTGINYTIPSNSNKYMGIMLDINDVTTNGVSGDDLKAVLYDYKYTVAQGSDRYGIATDSYSGTNANSAIVRNTRLIVTKNITSAAMPSNSEMDVYSFKVASVNPNVPVSIKQMKFAVTVNDDTTTANTLTVGTWKLFKNGTDITANVSITDASTTPANLKTGSVSEAGATVVVRFNSEESVTSETTYVLKATPAGFTTLSDSDNFTVAMLGDDTAAAPGNKYLVDMDADSSELIAGLGTANKSASEAANFIWSDNSVVYHLYGLTDNTGAAYVSTSSADWTNSYLIKNDIPSSAVQFTY